MSAQDGSDYREVYRGRAHDLPSGGSPPHLVKVVGNLEINGTHPHSPTEVINTTTTQGRLMYHLMGTLTELP